MIQYQAQVDRTNLVNVELTIEVNELKEAVKNAETNKTLIWMTKNRSLCSTNNKLKENFTINYKNNLNIATRDSQKGLNLLAIFANIRLDL